MKTLQPRLYAKSEKRETPAERGYDAWWRRERALHLSASPLCVYCAGDGRVVPASVVDHIVPHHGDRALFRSKANWQSLCANCHNGRKQSEEHRDGYR